LKPQFNEENNFKLSVGSQALGNTSVKQNYFSTCKSIVKVTKKGSQMFINSIDKMQETRLFINENQTKTQENICEKQLDYFKFKNKLINET
jgi:hypothetical protein